MHVPLLGHHEFDQFRRFYILQFWRCVDKAGMPLFYPTLQLGLSFVPHTCLFLIFCATHHLSLFPLSKFLVENKNWLNIFSIQTNNYPANTVPDDFVGANESILQELYDVTALDPTTQVSWRWLMFMRVDEQGQNMKNPIFSNANIHDRRKLAPWALELPTPLRPPELLLWVAPLCSLWWLPTGCLNRPSKYPSNRHVQCCHLLVRVVVEKLE